ncbi:hypothetical protein BH11PSE8_BH11PSE8_35870 [soil metagenome]
MDFERTLDLYVTLRRDLALAYSERHWDTRHIDRLADELAETERLLARLRPGEDWTLGLGMARGTLE